MSDQLDLFAEPEVEPDWSDLQRCGICQAAAGVPCGDRGFIHVGRRWELGFSVSRGGTRVLTPDGGPCIPAVEMTNEYDHDIIDSAGWSERDAILYRGESFGANPVRSAHHRSVVSADLDPCHIIAAPGDRRALCGVKDPYPHVWQPHAIKHRYPMQRCVECYQRAGLAVLFNLRAT